MQSRAKTSAIKRGQCRNGPAQIRKFKFGDVGAFIMRGGLH